MEFHRNVADHQEDSSVWLQNTPPGIRLLIGLLGCAVLAWCVPQFLVMVTVGLWKGTFSMWLNNVIGVIVLMALNFVGYKIKRVLTIGVICAIALFCYEASFIAHNTMPSTLQSGIGILILFLELVVPSSIFFLNSYLFVRFQQSIATK